MQMLASNPAAEGRRQESPMRDARTTESSVLRWGGLAGVAGAALFILTFAVVIGFGLPDPGDPQALVKFPDIRAARTLENCLYLAAIILWIPLFLALNRALRPTSLVAARFGSVLGVLGLTVLAAGALPHVASARISDLYHAPGATPADRATLVLMWQATAAVFEALLAAGIVLVTAGLLVVGVAMRQAPAFGRGFAWATVLLGAAGVAAASFQLVDPGSAIGAAGFLAVMVFQVVVGWKAYRLSRR
jgi:hypothetical protein